jgi:hypothetical protein
MPFVPISIDLRQRVAVAVHDGGHYDPLRSIGSESHVRNAKIVIMLACWTAQHA